MASYGLNWSTNASGNTIYSGAYADSDNQSYITIDSVYYNSSTDKIDINYTVKLYNPSGSRYNFTAAAAFFGGAEVKRWDPGDPIGGDAGSIIWSWSSWSNGSTVGSGTHSVSAGTTSITFGTKAMFSGGWGWNRWTKNQYCVSNTTGGTLYITQATYTVSYAANGGTTTPDPQTKIYNQALTLRGSISRNNSTANGYTVTYDGNGGNTPSATSQTQKNTTSYKFSKWKATNGTTYDGGGSYTANTGTTMTAQWTSSVSYGTLTSPTCTKDNTTSTRKVTFNATTNGGSCSTASLNSTATVTYSLNGWYTAKSGGTRRVKGGTSYTPSATETLYAQWGSSTGTFSQVTLPAATKSNGTATRTVTFNGNGGSTPSALKSNATITYTQTGWFTAASGGTNQGKSGTKYTPSAAEILYAQFSSSTGSYSAITLPTPTRTDYIFKGWSTDPDATSGITGSYTPSSNVTLYATWIEDQAKAKTKIDGVWKTGKAFIRVNGEWKKAKKIYHKVNGEWKIGKNS